MSIFKQNMLVILLLSVSSFLNAQSLDDYLKNAAENNPGIKARYAEFEASLQKVAQVNSLPNPQLSFGYFISPVETRVGPQRAKFSLSQMFPWFGTLAVKGEMAALLAEAKYQVFLNARNELHYKVKAAWYPLIEINQTIELQEANVEILNTFKQLSTTSLKNGKGSMVDVIRVDLMIENAATDIKVLQDKKTTLLTRFNTLLNRGDSVAVRVLDSLSLIEIETRYRKDSLMSAHPLLKAFDLKMQSAEAQQEVANKMGLPSFGVGLDYVLVGERTDVSIPDNGKNVLMPMVSISLPIFRKKYTAAIKEAEFAQQAIASSKEEYENELTNSYETAWFELNRASQLMELYKVQMAKTEMAIDLMLVAYSNSGGDFEEVLRMQQQQLKYQIAEAIALKDYYTALAKLDYLTAKPEGI